MEDLCRDSEVTTITPPGIGAVVVKELPETGKEGIVYIVDGEPMGIYEWDGEEFVSACDGGNYINIQKTVDGTGVALWNEAEVGVDYDELVGLVRNGMANVVVIITLGDQGVNGMYTPLANGQMTTDFLNTEGGIINGFKVVIGKQDGNHIYQHPRVLSVVAVINGVIQDMTAYAPMATTQTIIRYMEST